MILQQPVALQKYLVLTFPSCVTIYIYLWVGRACLIFLVEAFILQQYYVHTPSGTWIGETIYATFCELRSDISGTTTTCFSLPSVSVLTHEERHHFSKNPSLNPDPIFKPKKQNP